MNKILKISAIMLILLPAGTEPGLTMEKEDREQEQSKKVRITFEKATLNDEGVDPNLSSLLLHIIGTSLIGTKEVGYRLSASFIELNKSFSWDTTESSQEIQFFVSHRPNGKPEG